MTLRKRCLAALLAGLCALPAGAQEIRVGVAFAINQKRADGTIWENTSLRASVPIVDLVFREASESGLLPGGMTVRPVHRDSGCDDWQTPANIMAVMEELVVGEAVSAILEGDCDMVGALVAELAIPNGIPIFSLGNLDGKLIPGELGGIYHRMGAIWSERRGSLLAQVLLERGLRSAVLLSEGTFGERDAAAFTARFTSGGGRILGRETHEYTVSSLDPQLAKLAPAGGDALVVFATRDETFRTLFASPFMKDFPSIALTNAWAVRRSPELREVRAKHRKPIFGISAPVREKRLAPAAAPELERIVEGLRDEERRAHDAAALFVLALAKAGSVEGIGSALRDIANAPGEQILVGDLKRGLEIIAAGGEIDFVGATGFELLPDGNPAGNFDELELSGDEFVKVRSLPPE